MYQRFFQLRHAPFSIAPDPHYLFMSERHREALAHLLFGVDAGGGFVLLTGEIGAGKTTVCRCFLEQVPANCNVAYVFNPRLTAIELLRTICEEFRLPAAAPEASVKDLVDQLNTYLLASHAEGRNNVLIIDEAQNLSFSVLEQLRLLTNLETSERKLLQIILIGQPELRDMLARPELEQLAQRIIARYHLDALSVRETGAYISHRLAVAGLLGVTPFPPRWTRLIHRISRGVPRRINLLCDRALLGAYALGARQVDRRILLSAAREVFGADRHGAARHPYRLVAIAGVLAALAGGALVVAGLDWRDAASLARAPALEKPPTSSPAPAAGQEAASAPTAAADSAPPDVRVVEPAMPAPVLTELGGLLANAPTQEYAGLAELASLWQVRLGEGDPCKAAQAAGLRCFQSAGGLAELRQLGRPAIVTLRDDAGVQHYLPLVALGSAGAGLRIGNEVRLVSLVALGRRMPGRFVTLWRMPSEFRPHLKPGDKGPDVDWIAARLATINDYEQPAPGRQYDAAMSREVRAFQSAQGLAADGVVGPKTYMAVNGASGVPEPQLLEPQRAASSPAQEK